METGETLTLARDSQRERRDPQDTAVVVVAQEQPTICGELDGGRSAVSVHVVVPTSGEIVKTAARGATIQIAAHDGQPRRGIHGHGDEPRAVPVSGRAV